MVKQKSAAAAGAVATGPVPRPPVLEHTTAELVSLIANLSEREDFRLRFCWGVAANLSPQEGRERDATKSRLHVHFPREPW